MDINIFTQIGFVVLVGLASKNAILIVEFAKQQREAGHVAPRGHAGGVPAAAAADHDDLVRVHPGRGAAGVSHGAGAEMRRTLGTAVFSGMLGVTLFGIFLTPVFFYVIDWLGEIAAVRLAAIAAGSARSLLGIALGLGIWHRCGCAAAWSRPRPCSCAAADPWRPPTPTNARRPQTGTATRPCEPTDGTRRHCESTIRRRRRPSETAMFSQFLHRSPDLRLGAVDRHHAGRRHRRVHAADRAVSGDHAADGGGVGASIPGANAQVVADTVAAPIEQQVNGVENMLYMSSQCTNDGTYTLTVTFKLGIDLNMAQVLVQNRVALAQPRPARPGASAAA